MAPGHGQPRKKLVRARSLGSVTARESRQGASGTWPVTWRGPYKLTEDWGFTPLDSLSCSTFPIWLRKKISSGGSFQVTLKVPGANIFRLNWMQVILKLCFTSSHCIFSKFRNMNTQVGSFEGRISWHHYVLKHLSTCNWFVSKHVCKLWPMNCTFSQISLAADLKLGNQRTHSRFYYWKSSVSQLARRLLKEDKMSLRRRKVEFSLLQRLTNHPSKQATCVFLLVSNELKQKWKKRKAEIIYFLACARRTPKPRKIRSKPIMNKSVLISVIAKCNASRTAHIMLIANESNVSSSISITKNIWLLFASLHQGTV